MSRPYQLINGVKTYIDFEADSIKFSDGDSFQDKLDANALKGDTGADGVSPTVSLSKNGTVATVTITDKDGDHTTTISDGAKGDTGATGPAGSDANVNRTNIINALGYTPSNSGLTQAEVEQMIADSTQDDISVVALPFKNIGNTNIPPSTNYNGIFTWAEKTNSSGKLMWEQSDGTTKSDSAGDYISGGNLGANQYAIVGLTINANVPGLGVALGANQSGLWVKFKSSTSSFATDDKGDTKGASMWTQLCDRFGVLGQAASVACLRNYGTLTSANWKTWTQADFPYGTTCGVVNLDSKQYYFAIVMKYGSENNRAHLGTPYYTGWKGCTSIIMIPFYNVNDYNSIIVVSLSSDANGKMAEAFHAYSANTAAS